MSSTLQRSVRKYATMVAKFRRKHPDRPLKECLPGWALAMLRKMIPEGSYERNRLDEMQSPDRTFDDPIEFCCRLVSFENALGPEDGQRYLELAECVRTELENHGVAERSDWLDNLRASIARERKTESIDPEASVDGAASAVEGLLRIPGYPTVSNWIGVALFGIIALVCACLQYWTASLILLSLSLATLAIPAHFWEFDRSRGVLSHKSRSCIHESQFSMRFPLKDVVAVLVEVHRDSDGQPSHAVLVEFANSQTQRISVNYDHAERISRFLDVPKKTLDK